MHLLGTKPCRAISDHSIKWLSPASFQGAFPDNSLPPSSVRQSSGRSLIDLPVSIYLGAPEFSSCCRPFEEVAIVPVPETAVREKHRLVAGKYNIRLAWKIAVMQPESEPQGVQATTQDQFRLRVGAPDARHHAASHRRGNDVRHRRWGLNQASSPCAPDGMVRDWLRSLQWRPPHVAVSTSR